MYALKKLILVSIVTIYSILFTSTVVGQSLKVGVDHWPPFIFIDSQQSNGVKQDYASGIDIEIISAIAEELDLQLEFVRCPFRRCLKMMNKGGVEILSSLQKTKDREQIVHYIEPYYYVTNKVFYVLNNSNVSIGKYEDLYQLDIGVTLGHKNNPRFDSDKRIKKRKLLKRKHFIEC